MSKLKVGVIGCGSISRWRHLLEYAANQQVEIVAVCDIVEERAKEMAEEYNATAYKDYETMLSEADLDVVSVCTPHYLHAPMSTASSNAGMHVLSEKPMATSYEHALDMTAAAEKNGNKLMISPTQRF